MRQVPQSGKLSRERALQVDFPVHSRVHKKSLFWRSSEQRSQCAARSSRDLSAQPVHRTIPGRDFLKVASKMEALVGSQLKKVPRARGYGSRRTVFFGEASSKSRGRSDDSYTVRYSFRGRLHGISMISS